MSKSSVVWDYFTLEKDNITAKCGMCQIKLKHNKASTINLLNRNIRTIEEQEDNPAGTQSSSNAVSIYLFFKFNTYNSNIINYNY